MIRRSLLTFALASLALPATAVAAQPNPSQRALERRLGPQAVVDIDATTGTPRVLARLDGTLTGTASGAPEDVAMDYVRRNLDVLGLTESDLDTLQSPETSTAGSVTEVRWRQAVDGIPAADSELRVNLTRDRRVLNVLGSPAPDLDPDTTPSLTAGEAVRAVQASAGAFRALPRDSGPAGPTRATSYADGSDAELTLFKGRLAWRVIYHASSLAVFDAVVDAETGRVVRKHNMVKSVANALVWQQYPGAPQGGTAQVVDLEARGYLDVGANTLTGRYVRAWSDLNDDDGEPDGGEQITRTGGSFVFAFDGRTSGTGCTAGLPCSWNSTVANSWQANRSQNGVQAFYLANRFREHLAAPPINFTAEGFSDEDKLVLQTDDGAGTGPDNDHRNNANMLTFPEGTSPKMQMYLWGRWEDESDSGFRDINSGDDAAILYHEYAHGLSNRLITDSAGFGALNTPQAGAMGEAWSDWYAKDFLVQEFGGDTAAAGEVDLGVYSDSTRNKIRTQPLDCPVGGASAACPGRPLAGPGGYTYGDFASIAPGDDVHRDSEIWSETLWDLRRAIGAPEARRLISAGMRITPAEPTFLEARNAILQADAASGATHRAAIWQVFANRGMGIFATTTDSTDTRPLEDFFRPPTAAQPSGTIAGVVTDAGTGQPVAGVRTGVGGAIDAPGALAATSAADGSYRIAGVPAPRDLAFIVDTPGFDRLVVNPLAVAVASTTRVDARVRRNWAARKGGATTNDSPTASFRYTGLGCGPDKAIDQTANLGWSNDAGAPRSIVIRLPQTIDVAVFEMDPAETCGSPSGAAAAQTLVETSPTGQDGTWTPAAARTFVPTDRRRMNRVTPTAGRTGVQFVRLTVLTPQDPGSPFMDFSEFAVYSTAALPGATPSAPVSDPTPQPSPSPTATAIPTVTPTPTVAPTPTPLAAPRFTLPSSGKRSVRFKVDCRADCRVTARLVVTRSVARRLGLGRSRTAGKVTRSVKAGTRTLTLKLNSKAARALRTRKVRSFRGTLRVSAAYAGVAAESRSRKLTIRR